MLTSSSISRYHCSSSDKLSSQKHWLQIFSMLFSSNKSVGQINILIIMISKHDNFKLFLKIDLETDKLLDSYCWTSLLILIQHKNVKIQQISHYMAYGAFSKFQNFDYFIHLATQCLPTSMQYDGHY